MKITAELRLTVTPEQGAVLRAAMASMNAASNEAAAAGFAAGEFRQVSIHHRCYRSLRERFNLPAQMAVRAIAKAVSVFARDRRRAPVFRAGGAVGYDARMLTHRPQSRSVSILTLDGRLELPYSVGPHRAEAVGGRWGEAKLVARGATSTPTFYLLVAVEVAEPTQISPKTTLGVDLGVNTLAALSTGETFAGDAITACRERYTRRRATLQAKETKSSRRRLRQLSGRESRFVRGVNHLISRRVVDHAKALHAGLALEDLTGIRSKRSGGRKLRTLLNSWAFAQLRQFITYKAALAGVPLQVVQPADTSRTCSACGHCEKANRRGSKFKCVACGFAAHADLNAATNIAGRACPPRRGAEINRPMAPGRKATVQDSGL